MQRYSKYFWAILAVIILVFAAKPGQGGVKISIGGSFQGLMFIGGVIYFIIYRVVVKNKEKKCSQVLEKLDDTDPGWDPKRLRERVEFVFHKLIEAKNTRDAALMQGLMTEEYLELFKQHLAKTAKIHGKNLVKDVRIHEINFVNLQDYQDNNKDVVEVSVYYSAIDCLVGEKFGLLMEGSDKKPNIYNELWIFNRIAGEWVLSDIIGEPAIAEVLSAENKVEQ